MVQQRVVSRRMAWNGVKGTRHVVPCTWRGVYCSNTENHVGSHPAFCGFGIPVDRQL